MVNSRSFDAPNSKAEPIETNKFIQLEVEEEKEVEEEEDEGEEEEEDGVVPGSGSGVSPGAEFAFVMPEMEREDGLLKEEEEDDEEDENRKGIFKKTSLQCSVPLDKVKNVLNLCPKRNTIITPTKRNTVITPKHHTIHILENYSKPKDNHPVPVPNSAPVPVLALVPVQFSTSVPVPVPGVNKPALKRLLCLFCDRTFASNNLKQKHVDRCHSAGQTRRSSSRTPNHHQNHSSTACCFCSKLNQTEHTLNELLEHLVQEHSNRYFACVGCQERFMTSELLREHDTRTHEAEKCGTSPVGKVEFCSGLDFGEDFEENIVVNVIAPERLTKSTENETELETGKTKQLKLKSNKKLTLTSTKNGVRTRATLKQLEELNRNGNGNRNRKTKLTSTSDVMTTSIPNVRRNSSSTSVFSLVNAFIYKYEKIYDHSSDSIKDENSGTFNATFDKEFYTRTVCNIRENLLNHLDGKLDRNLESENRISHFEHLRIQDCDRDRNWDRDRDRDQSDNFGCDLSLNAITPVATLLSSSQYGDFDSKIEYGAKASQKSNPKSTRIVKYKFKNKKLNHFYKENDLHTDLTCLDMWTQLKIKSKQNGGDQNVDNEAKERVDELNQILDQRGPFEDPRLETNAVQFLELRRKSKDHDLDQQSDESIKDVYFILEEIITRVEEVTEVKPAFETHFTSINESHEIPNYLGLQIRGNPIRPELSDAESLEMSGEWARPRIYICATCGLKVSNLKALDDHKNVSHPQIWSTHYEFVGSQSHLYRHLSIPGLGKVGLVEGLPLSRMWQRSGARICSKCTKQCHNLGELHKHVLECGGDWTWMLARKKCKYRPYGTRSKRRRQRGYKRSVNVEIQREHKPKIKPIFIGPRPKPSKPSDAETIERMLANLPPKRHRKVISMRDGIQRPRKPYKKRIVVNETIQSDTNLSNKKVHYIQNNSTLKRKLSLRNQTPNYEPRPQLRSRSNQEPKENYKLNEFDLTRGTQKIRNKRMISRILGSKIFDSSVFLSRRRLVKAIAQTNLIRKTRLRSKTVRDNGDELQEQEVVVEDEKKSKLKLKSKSNHVKRNSLNSKLKSLDKNVIKKPDTINDSIDRVIEMAVKEEGVFETSAIELRVNTKRTKKISKLVQNMKSFNKKTKNELKEDKSETITSKLIRTFSLKVTKRKKQEKEVLKKTPEEIEKQPIGNDQMPALERIETSSNNVSESENIPILIPEQITNTTESDQIEIEDIVNNEPKKEEKQSVLKSTFNKLKTKIKRPTRGLNDCIAMLKCKLEQKTELNTLKEHKSDKMEAKPVPVSVPVLEIPMINKPDVPLEVQPNIELNYVVNETLKNCLMQCVKNKCQEIEGVNRKIGSVRKRKRCPNEKLIPNVPVPILKNKVSFVEKRKSNGLSGQDLSLTNVVDQELPLTKIVNEDLTLRRVFDDELLLRKVVNEDFPLRKVFDEELPLRKIVDEGLTIRRVFAGNLSLRNVIDKDLPLRKIIDEDLSSNKTVDLDLPLRKVLDEELPLRKIIDEGLTIRRIFDGDLPLKKIIDEDLSSNKIIHEEFPFERIVNEDLSLPKVNNKDLPLNEVIEEDLPFCKIIDDDVSLSKVIDEDLPLSKIIDEDLPLSQVIEEDLPLNKIIDEELPFSKVIEEDLPIGETINEDLPFIDSDLPLRKIIDEDLTSETILKPNIPISAKKKKKRKKNSTSFTVGNNVVQKLELELEDKSDSIPEIKVQNNEEQLLNHSLKPLSQQLMNIEDEPCDTVLLNKSLIESNVELISSLKMKKRKSTTRTKKNKKKTGFKKKLEQNCSNFKEHLCSNIENESELNLMENKEIKSSSKTSDTEDELPLAFLAKNLTNQPFEVENNLEPDLEKDLTSKDENLKTSNTNREHLRISVRSVENLNQSLNLPSEKKDEQIIETEIMMEMKENVENLYLNRNILNFEESIDVLKTPINNDPDFITTPDLIDSSLVLKIEKNLKVRLRKTRKTRRRVIPRSLNKGKRKDPEESESVMCEICNKMFKRKENLTSHKRTLTHIAKLSEIEARENLTKQIEMEANEKNKIEEATEEKVDDLIKETDLNPKSPSLTPIINSSNNNLKLVDIINEVLDKPIENISLNEPYLQPSRDYSPKPYELSNEPKKYKSLGERKSFDSDHFVFTPQQQQQQQKSDDDDFSISSLRPVLSKQLSLLENIIEETNPNLNYIEDSISLPSTNFEETLSAHLEDELNAPAQIKFVKPGFAQYEPFPKPVNSKENSTRNLNRDEELFLECCSLLKSGSEMSGAAKKGSNWMEEKQRDSFSWLAAQSSRVDTPIGEPFVSNDWSNSAVSSEWLSQKAPSPDVPIENNTYVKKNEVNNSNVQFENISTSEHSREASSDLRPLNFHNVDFSNLKFEHSNEFERIKDTDLGSGNEEQLSDLNLEASEVDNCNDNDDELFMNESIDGNLKKNVVSAFGGLVAKALTTGLHAVVRKSKKMRIKRAHSNTIQSSITDYTVPEKRSKSNSIDSDSSDGRKKLITKGAMKIFEGLKVSIPTQDLNLTEVLNGNVPKTTTTTTEKPEENKNGKIKNLFNRFGNKLGLRETKKKYVTSKLNVVKETHDVYEFDESLDNKLTFNETFSVFKNNKEPTSEMKNTFEYESESDDRFYDSMSFEEMSVSSESIQIHDSVKNLNQNQSVKKKSTDSSTKCVIMGRIFKNASKPKLEDKIPEIRDISSEENSKFVVENYLDSCSSFEYMDEKLAAKEDHVTVVNNVTNNKMSSKELDLLFDKLLEEERKIQPEKEIPNKTKEPKPKQLVKKKRNRQNSDGSSSSEEFVLGARRSKKHQKAQRKSPKTRKDGGGSINLEQEIKEGIGVAGRKSQRKCTSGKQNVLIEFWSSDESSFEEVSEDLLKLKEIQNGNEIEMKENDVIEMNSNSNQLTTTTTTTSIITNKNEIEDVYEFISEIETKPKTPKRNCSLSTKSRKSEHVRRRRKRKQVAGAAVGCSGDNLQLLSSSSSSSNGCLAATRKKRSASEMLYYWSSSSDDEFQDMIEVKPIREDTEDDRPMQHGWIVGDSPKKLVTMLAQAKGKKITDSESVKEQYRKNRIT